jgi:hypothetical protein
MLLPVCRGSRGYKGAPTALGVRGAKGLQGKAGGDSVKPADKSFRGPERLETAESRQEGRLDDILGFRVVPEDASRYAKGSVDVATEEDI